MKSTIVVVFYKQQINQSKTFQTLNKTLFSKKETFRDVQIILYDNSPDKQEFEEQKYEPIPISYHHDPRNLGIGAAYQFAWKTARDNGSQWLLLLDHDTELTEDYVNQIQGIGSFDDKIAAVVPMINSENTRISPVFSSTLRPLQGEKPTEGIQDTPIMAINSGALIKVSFLTEIGGFNDRFPLDYLDHWLFHEIYEKGYQVFVLNTILQHELSVMDYSRVSLKRYQSILDSEILFYKEYKTELLPSYKTQLVKRLLKQVLLVKNKKIAVYTLRRLFSI